MERFGIIVLLALCLAGCAKQDNARYERPALRVRTLVVTPQQQTASSRYVGSIEAIREVPLSLHMNSRIEAVYVHNGERVRAGQVLMLLDSTQAKNAVLSTQASLHRAQDAHARVKQVHEKGVVTDQKMVEVESQLAQAQAMYEAALQQLKECSLVACRGSERIGRGERAAYYSRQNTLYAVGRERLPRGVHCAGSRDRRRGRAWSGDLSCD